LEQEDQNWRVINITDPREHKIKLEKEKIELQNQMYLNKTKIAEEVVEEEIKTARQVVRRGGVFHVHDGKIKKN
jgi:hypothetical protein